MCAGYVDLNHGPLPYQESSRASDVPLLVAELPLPSINVRHRPLTVTVIVTQIVTRLVDAARLYESAWPLLSG